MGKRLDISDSTVSDLFGVDVEPRAAKSSEDSRVRVKFVDAKIRGPLRSVARERFDEWRLGHPIQVTAAIFGIGGVFGMAAVALLLPGGGGAAGTPPAGGAGSGAPGQVPRPPAGGTLVVDTRRTWQGRPVPGQLRASPGPTAQRVLEVPQGTIVAVLDHRDVAKNIWYHVRLPDGATGWMHSEVLK